MKRILLGAAMALVFAGTASAGIDTSKGSQSLIFHFEGLSNLGAGNYELGTTPSIDLPGGKGSLNFGGIGFRHFIGDGMAIRPGVNLAFMSESFEPEGDDEEKASAFAIGVNAVLEKFMAPSSARVAPYMGVGAGLGIANGKVEPNEDVEQKVNAFSFGAFGVLGFLAEIFDGVQLGAEYQGGLRLQSGSYEVDTEQGSSKDDGSSLDFGIGTLSFMLSVALR